MNEHFQTGKGFVMEIMPRWEAVAPTTPHHPAAPCMRQSRYRYVLPHPIWPPVLDAREALIALCTVACWLEYRYMYMSGTFSVIARCNSSHLYCLVRELRHGGDARHRI